MEEVEVATGYHGTSREARLNIEANNFKVSRGDQHWLGEGVYFFEDGIGKSGRAHAEEWADAAAWCNIQKHYKYEVFSVVRALIKIMNLWDLTREEGLVQFNYGRAEIMKKFGSKRPIGKSFDNDVIEFMSKIIGFDCIRAWFYIKTSADDRIAQIQSGVPNTQVLCVVDPAKSISLDDIKMVREAYVRKQSRRL